MLESKQIIAYDDPSKTFLGVRFVLLGFDSIKEEKVRLKLLEGGGVDAVNYGPDCNHVIVDKLVYDEPICVAARKDGKTLVNGLWVDHSFDVGMPVDPSSVMYRPMKDLNGIPGAKSLVVCLTGYQRHDRDDIMTMVALMGATFSKPLVANKVTHLICYKFDGEKYELAKKMKKIKLVNHLWLEDCLKAWELLPETDYDKSGYEIEMMAEAKDSEEETEDVAATIDPGRQNVVCPQDTSVESRSFHPSASKSLANDGEASKIHSTPGRDHHNRHLKLPSPFSATSPGKISPKVPSNIPGSTNISEKFEYVLASAAERANKIPDADTSKLSSKSWYKSTPTKHTSPLRLERSQSNVNKLGVSGGFDIDNGVKTPLKRTFSPRDEGQHANSPNKSKTTVSKGSSKPPMMSPDIIDERRTAKSPNKSKTTSPRGGSKSPMSNIGSDRGVKTHLKGTREEGESAKSPNKSKTTLSRGSSKSPTPNHYSKALMESESATKTDAVLASGSSINCISGLASSGKEAPLAPKEALSNSRKRLKRQAALPVQTNKSSGGTEINQIDIEPPFERADSGIGKKDGRDDSNITIGGNTAAPLNPLKGKLPAKKTLSSKRTIGKGTTAKLKGTLNLKKDILQNEYELRPHGEVATEYTTDDAPNDKGENVFVRGNNKEQYVEVQAPELGKGDISSEKESSSKTIMMKENSIEAGKISELTESKKSSKKTELADSKPKDGDAGKKKIAKGNKRPLSNAKTMKSKDSGEEVKENEKEDGKNSVSGNEETVALAGKAKTRPSKKLKCSANLEDNKPATIKKSLKNGFKADKTNLDCENDTRSIPGVKAEPAWFILSGHRLQRKDFQQLLRRLRGRVCRDSHHWSYQATHFIVPDPVKRTEKFFAAAASGSWILKTDYLTASNEAGRLLSEEPYEWHKKSLTEDGAINLEAPRKWRLLREKTGHGAFYGMRIVIYGECIAPPLDTLKRVIKAGDGTILATSPPYTRFFQSRIDFAIVSPGMPRVDMWVQEFLRHEVPCVLADYLVEYVCKPGYSLEKHVQYSTHAWAEKSLENLKNQVEEIVEDVRTPQEDYSDDIACKECGSRDRGEEMLICGDESGSCGCGVGMHFDCLDPPLDGIPEDDWFCKECSVKRECKSVSHGSKKKACKSKK
ncbi:hypothetical protein OROMI_030313 [Orobanche minor]